MSKSHYMYRTLRVVVEVECRIEFEAFPGYDGGRLEPSEGPSAEIYEIIASEAAFIVKGDTVELADESEVDLEQEALDELQGRDETAREDAYDRKRE